MQAIGRREGGGGIAQRKRSLMSTIALFYTLSACFQLSESCLTKSVTQSKCRE